jgi:hypothetical protein
MGLLFFKHRFAEAIVTGRKTTTLRRWTRPRCRAGQRVLAPGIGYLRVGRVERVRLSQLRRVDAVADGFASLVELRNVLRELYGNDERPLWRVEFVWEGRSKLISAVGMGNAG